MVDSYFLFILFTTQSANPGNSFAHHFLPVFIHTFPFSYTRSRLLHHCVTTVLCSSSASSLQDKTQSNCFLTFHSVNLIS